MMETEESAPSITPNSCDLSLEVVHKDTPPFMGRDGVSESYAKGRKTLSISESCIRIQGDGCGIPHWA